MTCQSYGAMDDVGAFVKTFKEFPSRSFPPSFVPATILEQTLDDIKDARSQASAK
jgi:arylsulfatase